MEGLIFGILRYVSEEFEALLETVIGLSGVWHEVLSTNIILSVTKCENLSFGIVINVNKSHWTSWFHPFFFSSWSWTADIPGHYFFIDFDWLSCAMWSNFNGLWHLLLGFHWFYNCPIWPVRLQAPGNRTGQIGQFSETGTERSSMSLYKGFAYLVYCTSNLSK